MKKLFYAFILLAAVCLFNVGTGHADDSIRLYLDGLQLKPEVPPKIMNGNTMVPVRIIAEELGSQVSWNQEERKVTVEKNGLTVQLVIDQTEALVNGSIHKLEAAPSIVNGNTLLPVRFISEKMGVKVVWDDLTRSVFLYKNSDGADPVTAESGTDGNGTIPAGGGGSAPGPSAETPAPEATPSPSTAATPSPAATPSSNVKPSPVTVPTPSASSAPGKEQRPGASAKPGSSATPPVVKSELQRIATEGDNLRITAKGGALKPSFIALSDPERLVVDLPGAALGKTMNGAPVVQNGEIATTHPLIAKIRYSLYNDNPSTVRIVIDLKQKIDYTLLDSKNPGELSISLKKARFKLMLDAGHGGTDSGAVSVNGRFEKDFNLAVVTKIAKRLEGIPLLDVRLTRSGDTYPTLDERVDLANEWKANLFVSVHANKVTSNPSVKGVETYYSRDDSVALADVLHRNILKATGSLDRKVRSADFRVIKYTTMPAVLCEIGYLSNPEEEQELFKEDVQDRVADSIANGIKAYLKLP